METPTPIISRILAQIDAEHLDLDQEKPTTILHDDQ